MKKALPKISIILATYNGGKFIGEQIESILDNLYFDKLVKEIIITDDGSSDDTVSILRQYQCSNEKIKILENNTNVHGVVANFSRGIIASDSEYIMLSDQDDVWLKNKISLSYDRIKRLESESESDVPILVFTDLMVVDENLALLSDSFFKHHKVEIKNFINFNSLILNNIAPGCTCIINRKLIDIALPIPKEALMHDWWFVLIAKSLGVLDVIPDATILYRQHSNNVIGAKKVKLVSKLLNIRNVVNNYGKTLESKKKQAVKLLTLKDQCDLKVVNSINYFKSSVFFPVIWERSFSRKILALISLLFCK
ncbi:glycosyltransferase family 2 protein [Serratia sp. D1N4]